MIMRYLEESFVNQTARQSLISIIRLALPSFTIKAVKTTDYVNDEVIIIAEEYLVDSYQELKKFRNIFLLVTECFVLNRYTGRVTRNLNSVNIVDLLAHILAFYIHLIKNFNLIGKISKWDAFLLPLIPPFFLIYLYSRILRKRTNIRSNVEHEYMLAGLQFSFDKSLPNISGIVFSHPSIHLSFNKFYSNIDIFKITAYPVFDREFQFEITGSQPLLLNWFGYRNSWREIRAREVEDQIKNFLSESGQEISVKYNFTSKETRDVFHLVMRQSANWPLSSATKIIDILNVGKIPVLEYNFCDHPVCDLALRLDDLINLYSSKEPMQVAIKNLEVEIRKKIKIYNSWAMAENMKNETNFSQFVVYNSYTP